MQWRGLTRIPYYPELEAVRRTKEDRSAQILSLMLYWHALPQHQTFNARKHAQQLSRSLRVDCAEVLESLSYLHQLGLLKQECRSFATNSQDPLKQTKTDTVYILDFSALSQFLIGHGVPVPVRVLKQAAADQLDFYAYLSPQRLPLIQGLQGELRLEEYEMTCRLIARLICTLCAGKTEAEAEFARTSVSPAWHMLCQPPVSPEDIASRWLRKDERAIDLDLTDGAFFLPDADSFGTVLPHLWHCGKRKEPRILASALYLCPTTLSSRVHFISDLPMEDLLPALTLLHKLTGALGRIDEAYYEHQQLSEEQRQASYRLYLSHLEQLQRNSQH